VHPFPLGFRRLRHRYWLVRTQLTLRNPAHKWRSVHELAEEKVEYDVKHHKRGQLRPIVRSHSASSSLGPDHDEQAHTLSDAERRNEVIAGKRHDPIPGGRHGVDG
jgi:hypothetical protein